MNSEQEGLRQLLENNRAWATRMEAADPEFFRGLVAQQSPKYLWIGCSDSRVPANTIIGLKPGEVFVHRNVGNVVVHTDFNCLSVIQYAVEVLGVEHIIVCGHYGCGGVRAALQTRELGLLDNWLRHVKDIYVENRAHFDRVVDFESRVDLLSELNVIAQVEHVCQTTIVQGAWRQGRRLAVHGWIYSVADGLIRDLERSVSAQDQLDKVFRMRKPL